MASELTYDDTVLTFKLRQVLSLIATHTLSKRVDLKIMALWRLNTTMASTCYCRQRPWFINPTEVPSHFSTLVMAS
jgi:hypothetical protein